MRNAHIRDGVAKTRYLMWLEDTLGHGNKIKLSEFQAATKLEQFRKQYAGCATESSLLLQYGDPTQMEVISPKSSSPKSKSSPKNSLSGVDTFVSLSFPTISGSGPNASIIHYKPDEDASAVINPKSLYLVDSGAQYVDGTTDVTRTVFLSQTERPPARFILHYTLVLKGHIGLAMSVFPKHTPGPALDILARSSLWKAGLNYNHGTGHGVGAGLNVHEGTLFFVLLLSEPNK